MRILVTGGAGYIGSHTIRRFLAHGHEVVVFDNLSVGHREAVPSSMLVVGDLGNAADLKAVFAQYEIEAVVHFAASALVGESMTDPAKYYRNNLVNSLNLLDQCCASGVNRFIFSSTCATYGLPTTIPITEAEPQRPVNPYGNSKLAFERALADYAAAYQFGYCALRYFNAAGASPDGTIGEDHDPESHLLPLVLQTALGRRPHVEIYGTDYPTPDGTCVRDYIHVDDLAEAHVMAMDALDSTSALTYNVGVGRGFSVRELIRTVEEVSGLTVPVKKSARRPGDPPILVANAEKIRRELNWSPKYTELRPIVETAWNWHRTHPDGFRKAE